MRDMLDASGIVVPRAQELGEQVVGQLRLFIIRGTIASGTHLVESQLSETFEVSRGPIRDALVQLEAEGLVVRRKRGAFVVGLSTNDIDELYSLRESLEIMAMREAGRHSHDPDWNLATDSLEAMRAAAENGDHESFAHADLAFHSTFYDLAGHRRLRSVWSQYEPTFAGLISVTTAEDIDLMPSYGSHVEIHRLMRAGDLETATLTLREHLLGSRTRLISAYARLSLADEPSK